MALARIIHSGLCAIAQTPARQARGTVKREGTFDTVRAIDNRTPLAADQRVSASAPTPAAFQQAARAKTRPKSAASDLPVVRRASDRRGDYKGGL